MTTYVFGQKKQRVSVVLYEEFTGDGSDVTFQLTSSPDNATWLATHGAWAAGNIHTTYPGHVTKTNKKPIYDSIIPLTRNRIGVSSINASGLVTLDYAPRNNVDFYIWYWYQLSTDDILSAYVRPDFIASMEGEMIGALNIYDTDSSNVLSIAWAEDSSNDRVLNLAGLVGGDRTLDMSANLTVESNAIVSQDYTSDSITVTLGKLTLTSGQTTLLDLNPSFTGTGNAVDLTPSAPIATEDATWCGLNIDGSALSPSAVGVNLQGANIDFSAVDLTRTPHMDGLEITMPVAIGSHALHLTGEYHQDLDFTGAAAGETHTGNDIVVETAGSTGGEAHVIDVARGGAGSVAIHALGTHESINVIRQDIGTFASFDKVFEYDNDSPGWADVTAGNAAVWDDKDDIVYFGHASTFSEIQLILTTPATKDMFFTFAYSVGSSSWTAFSPADDTEGGRQNGTIRFDAADLAGWATDTVNSIASKYWIRITRNRTSGTGPTVTTFKQLAPTEYVWDKDGNVSIKGLTLAGNLALAANSITGTSVDISNAELQQLSNIGAATISSTQWGHLGSSTTAGGAVLDAADDAAILALLSGDAGAAFSWNSQNLTSVGTIGCGTITTTGNLVLPANGVVGVTDGNPRILFDNANNQLEITGKVGIGATAPEGPLHVAGTSQSMFFLEVNNDTYSWQDPRMAFLRSRGTYASKAPVVSGDEIGTVGFRAHDGSGWEDAAAIQAYVDGTPSDGTDMPGRLEFKTTLDGTDTLVTRMIIKNDGNIDIVAHDAATIGLKLGGTLVTASAAEINQLDGNLFTTKVEIDQSVVAAAIPPLKLTQADVSEDFIHFTGRAAAGVLTQSLVDDGDVSSYTRQAWIKIYIEDLGDQITDGFYYLRLYSIDS